MIDGDADVLFGTMACRELEGTVDTASKGKRRFFLVF